MAAATSPTPRQEDIMKMLKCNTHLGTKNCEVLMDPYVYKRRSDGMFTSLNFYLAAFPARLSF